MVCDLGRDNLATCVVLVMRSREGVLECKSERKVDMARTSSFYEFSKELCRNFLLPQSLRVEIRELQRRLI